MGRGGGGSWKSQFANIGHKCLPWQPTIAARLLGRPASSEPYNILIMVLYLCIDYRTGKTSRRVLEVKKKNSGEIGGFYCNLRLILSKIL
jgi:hypothetical protein